jgi:hypothetical protein
MSAVDASRKFIVITTINPLNEVLEAYAALPDWRLVVVGDRKGPKGGISHDRLTFLGIDGHNDLGLDFPRYCPENSYARKNVGYLYALSQGAEVIAETDDDNAPRGGWGTDVRFSVPDGECMEGARYFNVYREFTKSRIWPRGYPLDRVTRDEPVLRTRRDLSIGAWQFLADRSPDVDAIYRLTHGDPVYFDPRAPFALAPHVYCPFNSQNTFWRRETFPFMYMPLSVTIRFTDILRGYVAQRLMWDAGMMLGFGPATVIQDRNAHDLMRDFNDEVPMYLQVERVVDILEALPTGGSAVDRLVRAYASLREAGIVTPSELQALEAWAGDLRRLGWK